MLRVALVLISYLVAVNLAFAQAAQTPSDSRLKRIGASKTIKIGYRTDATPFSFVNPQNPKEPTGYTIELCKLVVASIQKQLGLQNLKTEWVQVTSQSRFEAIAKRQADMECAASTITLGRMKQVDFSSIVFVDTTGIVAKADAGINSAADLAGKKVVVIGGTTNERVLLALKAEGKLNVNLVTARDRGEAVGILEGGNADAFASDKLLLLGANIRDASKFKMLPDDLSHEPYGIALPRGDWALRLAVNTGLAQAYRSGEAFQLFQKWFSPVGLRPGVWMLAAFHFGAMAE
jgi:ABC-type amino acid transport substrate-binding protein